MRLDSEFIDESNGFFSMSELVYENSISKAIKKGSYCDDDNVKEYMSKDREKILEWYQFHKECELLELGGALGALTGLFCNKCKKVTVVENKKVHCEIIRGRWGAYDNLEVINDNPVFYKTENRFDFIVIHEIWGYVKKLRREKDSYQKFLLEIKSLLKPEGKLIVVADNRIALKYFNGAIDEYSKKLFCSLNDYKGYSYIKSFSLSEILDLLNSCGFGITDKRYVFSDWHFPSAIYSEDEVNDTIIDIVRVSGYNYFSFFGINEMYQTLQHNKCAGIFSDAFIIEAVNVRPSVFNITNKTTEAVKDKKGEYKFPYLDEVDIIEHGYKESMEKDNEHALVKEQRIINRFIKDVYGDDNTR